MKERIAKIVFVIVQMAIFYFSIFTDMIYLNEIRYLSVLLSLLFAFFFFNVKRFWKYGRQFIIGGLLFTATADYFLVIANEQYELGVLLFLVAQYSYFLYLSTEMDSLHRMRQLGLRMGGGMVIISINYLLIGKMIPIIVLAIFYAAFSVGNLITAYRKFKTEYLLAIGLTLFAMCDICVVISYLNIYFKEVTFCNTFRLLVWVFYIPSQVLISLCACQEVLEIE